MGDDNFFGFFLFHVSAASDASRERNLHVRLQTPREHFAVGEVRAIGNQKGMARSLGKRLHGTYLNIARRCENRRHSQLGPHIVVVLDTRRPKIPFPVDFKVITIDGNTNTVTRNDIIVFLRV